MSADHIASKHHSAVEAYLSLLDDEATTPAAIISSKALWEAFNQVLRTRGELAAALSDDG